MIIRETDRRISIELGREDRKWAIKNVCAPCLYKTVDEPKLKFEFLGAMDGNNSLKLVDSTYRAGIIRTDTRKTESARWIKPEDVDLFKDEVGKVRISTAVPDTSSRRFSIRAICEVHVKERLPPTMKISPLKKRHGSMSQSTMILPSAWIPAWTGGRMQVWKHVRRCSPFLLSRASS